eukprot:CAMPEP_0198228926 /NCGR_PEP_ID=MMETSP1445-20131203/113855_1 /TAXON_ID=36898 /ORGANISM="Pyramimonas sp., Strain CCMP2087" /LENGTH=303 /DNA_ID=CAMNT_0043909363 /DNA_START=561 /DNA_END=1472 /DNA_ORIENTATION=-
MARVGDVLKKFISSCYRSNLHISLMIKADVTEKKRLHSSGVMIKAAVATQVLDFIIAQPEETMYTGIIYCTTIEDVMNVTALLKSEGISAMPYHGRLSKDEKDGALKSWLDETVRVVVATMAFGMGIDKASVRWVLHFSLPRSMENLAQEMGRAGRDQNRSECCIMFSASDQEKIKNTLHKDPASQAPKDEKDGALKSWLDETGRVVVATMAFGMGIDKASVRWVLHFSLPRSMENLAQEMDRAGRDQNRSECCIMFSASDQEKIKNTLHKDPASQARMGKCLQDVVSFCINEDEECRHYIAL